jgi:hypothetical protein
MSEKEIFLTAIEYFINTNNDEDVVARIFTDYDKIGGVSHLEHTLFKFHHTFDATPPFSGSLHTFRIKPHKFVDIKKLGSKKYLESITDAYNKEKKIEEIRQKKDEIDLKNAERVYKSYPYTQTIAWVSFVIAILLGYVEIAQVLKLWPFHK